MHAKGHFRTVIMIAPSRLPSYPECTEKGSKLTSSFVVSHVAKFRTGEVVRDEFVLAPRCIISHSSCTFNLTFT